MKKNFKTWIVISGLILLAAFPRIWQLGELGFYGDEETTALATYSVSLGEVLPRMPSGMPYTRAFPQTFLNEISARVFGLDEEIAHRLPAAILGVLTVPVLFLLARPWLGTSTALVAAVLLAVSEWHIATSREARMYAPFLLFYLIALLTLWRWSIHGGWRILLAGTTAFIAAMSFHVLALSIVALILLPLLFADWIRNRVMRLFAAAFALGAMGVLYHRWINTPLSQWNTAQAQGTAVTEHFSDVSGVDALFRQILEKADPIFMFSLAAGAAIGMWISRVAKVLDEGDGAHWRRLARYVVAAFAGAFTASGRLYGAALLWLLFLAFYPAGLSALWHRARAGWVILAALSISNVTWVAFQAGITKGIRQLFFFPFPYAAEFLIMFSAVFVLFALASAYAVATVETNQNKTPRLLVMTTVVPMLGLGLVSQWAGMRYLIGTYPFLLLLASMALLGILEWTGQRLSVWTPRSALVIALVLVLSGVLGGHGLPQAFRAATVEHGDRVGFLEYDIFVYPDHAAPGRFVARHRLTSDLVVAEDVLQQRWYVGHVDYALHDPDYYRAFSYRAKDGLRDIYVNSRLLDMEELRRLREERERRIWVITSGETHHSRERHLTPAQIAWLVDLEKSYDPAFTGRDGLSKVYCLNCDKGKKHGG